MLQSLQIGRSLAICGAAVIAPGWPPQQLPYAEKATGRARIIKEQQGARRSCCAASLVAAEWTVLATAFCHPVAGLALPAPSSSYSTGRISIPLPDPNCAGSHPSPIHRHLRLSRQESFSKSHRLKPSAPTCYPLHHFWDRLIWVHFALEVVRNKMRDSTWQAVTHLVGDEGAVSLAFTACYYEMMGRLNSTFALDAG